MKNFVSTCRKLRDDKSGAAMIEYTALLGVILAVAIGTIAAVGTWAGGVWTALCGAVGAVGTAAAFVRSSSRISRCRSYGASFMRDTFRCGVSTTHSTPCSANFASTATDVSNERDPSSTRGHSTSRARFSVARYRAPRSARTRARPRPPRPIARPRSGPDPDLFPQPDRLDRSRAQGASCRQRQGQQCEER